MLDSRRLPCPAVEEREGHHLTLTSIGPRCKSLLSLLSYGAMACLRKIWGGRGNILSLGFIAPRRGAKMHFRHKMASRVIGLTEKEEKRMSRVERRMEVRKPKVGRRSWQEKDSRVDYTGRKSLSISKKLLLGVKEEGLLP